MKPVQRNLAWYHTTVFRAVCFALLIVMGGYLGGLGSIQQALQSLAAMAYDDELDKALADYMDSLKELDSSKRQTLLLEIKAIVDDNSLQDFDEMAIRELLLQADVNSIAPIDELQINPLIEVLAPPELTWLSRTELRIGQFIIRVPTSEVHHRFEQVQQIKQRYELIEATWDKEISPSLLLSSSIILFVTFTMVILVLVWLVKRYIRDLQKVLQGFRRWSESDPSYRLPLRLAGEMGHIALQFNTMADEVELNRKKTLYLEKLASWQTMARKLAHEIKNPLTPIQMMVSQLQRKYRGDDIGFQNLLNEATTIIHEEVDSLRRLVDHFSQFASLPDPKWEQANLLALCQQVIELELAAFPEHDLRFETDLASAPLLMDSQLMRQVLVNLLKNAAEASPKRHAQIVLRLELLDNHYELSVIDDGPGIPNEDLGRIFEAYFTTKHTGANPGMGLGLAICNKIVMDHRGELKVSSKTGHTVFCMVLPIKHSNEALF